MYDCEFFPFFGMPYGLGWVFMAVFWVFVIAGVIALVRWLANSRRDSGQGTSSPGHKNPTDILPDTGVRRGRCPRVRRRHHLLLNTRPNIKRNNTNTVTCCVTTAVLRDVSQRLMYGLCLACSCRCFSLHLLRRACHHE